jgi:hypothetical protein
MPRCISVSCPTPTGLGVALQKAYVFLVGLVCASLVGSIAIIDIANESSSNIESAFL